MTTITELADAGWHKPTSFIETDNGIALTRIDGEMKDINKRVDEGYEVNGPKLIALANQIANMLTNEFHQGRRYEITFPQGSHEGISVEYRAVVEYLPRYYMVTSHAGDFGDGSFG